MKKIILALLLVVLLMGCTARVFKAEDEQIEVIVKKKFTHGHFYWILLIPKIGGDDRLFNVDRQTWEKTIVGSTNYWYGW